MRRRTTMHGVGSLAMAGVLLAIAAGCSSDAETGADQAPETDADDQAPEGDTSAEAASDGGNGRADLDIGDDSMSFDDGDGTSVTMEASAEIPEVIADLVPLPDGFVPEATTEATIEDGVSTMVTGTLDTDDPAAVLSDIEDAVAADGFETLANSQIGGEMFTLSMVKEDEAQVTVGIIDDDEGEPADMNVTVVHPQG